MSWNEDKLLAWIGRAARPALLVGSQGHDAAVLRAERARDVQCADQTIEGVHFQSSASPRAVGRKAANRALSDLAATAATPRTLLLTLRAPQERSESWLRQVIQGVRSAAAEVGAELVGGDLACADGPAALTVFAQGLLPGRRTAPGRDRARPGQRVVLSGAVGGSGLGRHLTFQPRIEIGRALHAAGASAMMDISDGLAKDLDRLARASQVAIDLEHVPLHRDAVRAARLSGRTPLDHALHDGEDHELVATIGRAKLPLGVAVIGTVRPGRGLFLGSELCGGHGRRWSAEEGGWCHGE